MPVSSIRSRRGGHATTAKSFEETVLDAKEAAALLRRPISTVREQAHAGELPVMGWDRTQPFFKAGDIMALVT